MHTPATALPGAAGLLLDPASQRIADQAFAPRRTPGAMVELVEPFRAPAAFLNAWVDFGAPYNLTGFWRDRFGVVHLRGLLTAGAIGSAAFTLPAGYRPAATEMMAAVSNGAFGIARVLATGDVVPFAGSNVYFSLDGITFRAA